MIGNDPYNFISRPQVQFNQPLAFASPQTQEPCLNSFSNDDNRLLVQLHKMENSWDQCAIVLNKETRKSFSAKECEEQFTYLRLNFDKLLDPILKAQLQEHFDHQKIVQNLLGKRKRASEKSGQTEKQNQQELETLSTKINERLHKGARLLYQKPDELSPRELETLSAEINENLEEGAELLSSKEHLVAPLDENPVPMDPEQSVPFTWTDEADGVLLDLRIAGKKYGKCARKLQKKYSRQFSKSQISHRLIALRRGKGSNSSNVQSKLDQIKTRTGFTWTEEADNFLLDLIVAGKNSSECATEFQNKYSRKFNTNQIVPHYKYLKERRKELNDQSIQSKLDYIEDFIPNALFCKPQFAWTEEANLFLLDLIIKEKSNEECADEFQNKYDRKFTPNQMQQHYLFLKRRKKEPKSPDIQSKLDQISKLGYRKDLIHTTPCKPKFKWTEEADLLLLDLIIKKTKYEECAVEFQNKYNIEFNANQIQQHYRRLKDRKKELNSQAIQGKLDQIKTKTNFSWPKEADDLLLKRRNEGKSFTECVYEFQRAYGREFTKHQLETRFWLLRLGSQKTEASRSRQEGDTPPALQNRPFTIDPRILSP